MNDINLDELGLNINQEEFVREYIRNGGNSSKAYHTVYQCKLSSAKVNGPLTLKKEGVQKYLTHLRQKIRDTNVISLNDFVKDLKELEEECKRSKKYDVAVDCCKLIANVLGFNSPSSKSTDNSQTQINIQILPPSNVKDSKHLNISNISNPSKNLLQPPAPLPFDGEGDEDNNEDK